MGRIGCFKRRPTSELCALRFQASRVASAPGLLRDVSVRGLTPSGSPGTIEFAMTDAVPGWIHLLDLGGMSTATAFQPSTLTFL